MDWYFSGEKHLWIASVCWLELELSACGEYMCGLKYRMICIIGESMTKFCSPKFQVPNMCYRLKFTDVFVAPNYQICIIGGLKFDWNLSAYVLVKPHFLIEEPFYLTWGRERLVRNRQYAGVPSILLGRMGRRLAWPQHLQPFWQPLQADKLWVTICMWV